MTVRPELVTDSEPRYRQRFEPFRPNLSVVDLLFAMGPAAAGLLSARRKFERVLPVAPNAVTRARGGCGSGTEGPVEGNEMMLEGEDGGLSAVG